MAVSPEAQGSLLTVPLVTCPGPAVAPQPKAYLDQTLGLDETQGVKINVQLDISHRKGQPLYIFCLFFLFFLMRV